ncbi:MAG: GAF domain-containing protein, partial [Nostocaceae cyanobacterium]|nr:GAF domain-containing protein [Nostocaceae cyanobacterium]
MTNAYQESQENGYQKIDIEKYENSNGNVEMDLEPIDRQFKILGQRLNSIVSQMHPAADLDSLLQITVSEIRKQIESDRVFVYRFNSPESGVVVSESRKVDWTPIIGETLPTITFGASVSQDYLEVVAIDDITKVELTPYQLQLLERFQVKASLSLPIFLDGGIWGLLVVNNCTISREWQEFEISLLSQVTREIGHRLSRFEYLQQKEERSQKLAQVTKRQQNLLDLTRNIGELLVEKSIDVSTFDLLLQTTVAEARKLLQSDRVAVYCFNPDWSGEFIAESVGKGWLPFKDRDFDRRMLQDNGHCDSIQNLARNLQDKADPYFQKLQGGRYQHKKAFVVNDVSKAGFPPCYTDLLEQFEAKAYLTIPIFKGDRLWGLLASYQHSDIRTWEEYEVKAMQQIALQLGVALQQAENFEKLQKTAQRDRTLNNIIDKIRQSLDIDTIFSTTTKEVRKLVQADRVVVYRFNPDWSGMFVSESMGSGWQSLMEKQDKIPRLQENISNCNGMRNLFETSNEQNTDTYLQATQGGELRNRKSYVTNDIYNSGFSDCYVEVLEQYQAKAYVIVPIFQGQKLWGMLAAFQNDGPREWEEIEVNLLSQIANQLGVALKQAEILQQVQQKSEQIAKTAELDRVADKIVDKIRKAEDINRIFSTSTKELQLLLNVDRVALYRFNPDWSGEFIAESLATGWLPLVGEDIRTVIEDTYLQDTQGGRYRLRENHAVNDIYKAGYNQCHIEILESLQARAYIIVPVFSGQQLWGLFAAYQNSGPREWLESEVNVLARVGDQLGVAIKQAEYLQQLQLKSKQIELSAQRDRAVNKIVENLRENTDLDSSFRATAKEVRILLKADRVGVFRFLPESGYDDGEIIAEDVLPGYASAMNVKVHDHCFGEQFAPGYREGRFQAVSDIYNGNLSHCHIDILAQFQVKANLIVPLLKGSDLWGLLCIHQCDAPREWQEEEIELVKRIAYQLGVSLQQAEYLQQLQEQSAKVAASAQKAQSVNKIIERLRENTDLTTAFRSTAKEVRILLKADRVGVFRFLPESGYDDGEIIAEDVLPGYASAMNVKVHDHCFGEQFAPGYR